MDLYDSDGSLRSLVASNMDRTPTPPRPESAPSEGKPLVDPTEAAYLALHVADWGQTRNIAKHPDTWHETNPILGKHPSTSDVDRYFALTGLGHVALSKLLEDSPTLKNWFQGMTIMMEAGTVRKNKINFGINSTF
jgi:hypothetical protein